MNAAGLTHYSLLVATKQELVDDIVRTNLMGTIYGCQIMVRRMMRRKQGVGRPGIDDMTLLTCVCRVYY